MQTAKPKGFAKIWREIKRPFGQGFRRIVQMNMAVLAIRDSLVNPTFIENLFENTKPFTSFSQETWNEFLGTKPDEIKNLYDRLVANTDELSRDVVSYYIVRRRFCMEHGDNPMWNVFSQFRAVFPYYYEEQERVKSLCEGYKCPYQFPESSAHAYCVEQMALGFGLNQFPSEIQTKIADKDIIDGGGFSGDSAMKFTEYKPRNVYTFEPNPDTIPVMHRTFTANETVLESRKDRIEIVPLALGKSKGTLTLCSRGKLDAGATVSQIESHASATKTYEIGVISIDEFEQERALDVGLIKLDVEGAEYDTILGAKETITKQKPLLIISIYHTFKDFFEIKPLIESWELGYKFAIRQHVPDPDADFMLIAY